MLDKEHRDVVNASTSDMASRASIPTPPPEGNDVFTEPDASANQSDTDRFFNQRGNMLAQQKIAEEGKGSNDSNMVKLSPMSQLSASSTIVNLLLATGPFSYVNLGSKHLFQLH